MRERLRVGPPIAVELQVLPVVRAKEGSGLIHTRSGGVLLITRMFTGRDRAKGEAAKMINLVASPYLFLGLAQKSRFVR